LESLRREIAALSELRVEFREFRSSVERSLDRVQPILDQRSGFETLLRELRRDLDASHDKHRQHFSTQAQIERDGREAREVLRDLLTKTAKDLEGRMQTMEKREARLVGWFTALVSVIMFLLQFVLPLATAYAKAKLGL